MAAENMAGLSRKFGTGPALNRQRGVRARQTKRLCPQSPHHCKGAPRSAPVSWSVGSIASSHLPTDQSPTLAPIADEAVGIRVILQQAVPAALAQIVEGFAEGINLDEIVFVPVVFFDDFFLLAKLVFVGDFPP